MGLKTREGGAVALTLAQDGDPREAGLRALEHDALQERGVAVHRHRPLVVVIGLVQRVSIAEATQGCGGGGGHGSSVAWPGDIDTMSVRWWGSGVTNGGPGDGARLPILTAGLANRDLTRISWRTL
ncbi:hypothetical protein GCM10025876_17470 [Demequina litorisediminis]|uniref:Uncharacterized protein n=1 Tax=Demequina litorisediminis TaxID=1849022 RepID=A0ABQ6ICH5_9MICO|nr:hypothetical protein GCM10025876_17470 [Demequina litorisediminis]